MQLSLEARQRIHERYERQSVSQRQLAEDFQVSLSMVKRILKRSKDDLGRRAGSGNPGKIHERERQCLAEYAQQYPDAFLREYADGNREDLQGARHRASGQCAPQKTQMDAQKNRPISGIPLGALATTVAALYRRVDPIAAGTQGRVLWGDETALYDDWIRHRAAAPVGQPVENFNHQRTQPRNKPSSRR